MFDAKVKDLERVLVRSGGRDGDEERGSSIALELAQRTAELVLLMASKTKDYRQGVIDGLELSKDQATQRPPADLDYAALMQTAQIAAQQAASKMYPPGARREEMERRLTRHHFRQYTERDYHGMP